MALQASASPQFPHRDNVSLGQALTLGTVTTAGLTLAQMPTVPLTNSGTQLGSQYAQVDFSPYPSSDYTTTVGRYLVYVESDSSSVLQRVRTEIEPGAFFKTIGGRTVIQTGSFNNYSSAQQQIASLQAAGFSGINYAQTDSTGGSTIPGYGNGTNTGTPIPVDPTIPTTPVTPTPGYGTPGYGTTPGYGQPQPGILRPSIPYGATAYYVVIPGGVDQLPNLQQRIIQLGADISAVQQRVAPRGPHVAVGPFSNRGDAETWTSYFRDYGLDARVYYGR